MSEKTQSHLLDVLIQQERLPQAQGWVGSCTEDLEQKALKLAQFLFEKEGSQKHQEKLKANTHPDFLVFEPSSKTGQYTIEQIRHISDKSQLYPHEAPAQVFLLRHAERMPIAASNAFLKTLEEPSEKTYFILLIEHLEELLPTLKSRLHLLSFHKEGPIKPVQREELLEAFLHKWPHFTYQELYHVCQTLQEDLDHQSLTEVKEIVAQQREIEALFTQVELWYTKNKDHFSFSYRYFQKHFEKAKLGVLRSIKFSLSLEYLMLSLKQKQ